MNETIDLMKKHTSVRRFTDEQISDEDLKVIIDAGRAASSWKNFQSYSIIVVRNQEKKAALFDLVPQRLFVSHLFFFFLSETSIELRKVCDFIRIPFTHKEWRIF